VSSVKVEERESSPSVGEGGVITPQVGEIEITPQAGAGE
jgi:hypothetical protein